MNDNGHVKLTNSINFDQKIKTNLTNTPLPWDYFLELLIHSKDFIADPNQIFYVEK